MKIPTLVCIAFTVTLLSSMTQINSTGIKPQSTKPPCTTIDIT
ncbi:unnamed protein product [Brassica rapa subsp. narinosa]|uniref:Uncharacterized protein n=2 Tax=Brassica TaxID=3705 RepID=A0A3P5Y7L6_BRACM|nr:unnamed protein product [Brassica napus]VDC58425.1 unnamed protein product [Brassica rapa]